MKSTIGAVIVFVGSVAAGGIAHAQTIDLASGGADPIWRGTQAGARAGAWLDQGPLNSSDTRRDLIIGVPGGPGVAGAVYAIFGGPIRTGDLPLSSADVTIHGAATGDLFGTSTAVGNVLTTEGTAPRALAVGAPGALNNKGIVYVFRAAFSKGDSVSASDAVVEVVGMPGDKLGWTLATGDLNNDGYRELIIGAPGNNRVYVIAGGPSLPATIDLSTTAVAMAVGAPGFGETLTAGDVTGDGIYDLLIGAPASNAMYVIKGKNGTMPASAVDMIFSGIDAGDLTGTAVRLADLDADGVSDIFVSAPNAAGPGNARPGAGEVYLLWGGPSLAGRSLAAADVTFYGADNGGRMGESLASGDINRDSPNDLVLNTPGSRNGGALYVYYGRRNHNSIGVARGDGTRVVDFKNETPSRAILGDQGGGTVTAAQVFEVTGEGARDVIVGMSGNNNNVGAVYFALSPRLTLSPAKATINGFQGSMTTGSVQVVNASAIGIGWTAVSNSFWLTATASGSTAAGAPGTITLTANGNGLGPGTLTGTVTVTSTSNHLTMSVPLTVTFVVKETQPSPTTAPVSGMPNGAKYQILWRHNTEGWLAFWNMNGVNVTGASSVSINQMTDTQWRIAGFADVNGDGQRDIIWQHTTEGWLAVWFLQGSQVTGTSYLSVNRVDPNWWVRAAGDVNGDGRADIIFQHKTEGWLAVWYLNGAQVIGSYNLGINRMTDPSWQIAAAGDVDGDGKADILWQSTQGSLAVWLLNGTQVTATRMLSTPNAGDLNWKVVGATDVDGDGKADILWQHTDGSIATWWLNAEQVRGGSNMNPGKVSNAAWRVAGPR